MSKKSRKLINAAQSKPEPSAPEAVVEPVVEQTFWFLPDTPPEPVDERDLHEAMKQWRHGRATRTIGEAIQNAYVAIFTIVMIGAMITNLVLKAQSSMAGCAELSCQSARTLVPWATWFALLGLALGVSRLFGPVLVSAAEGFWLMDAPIERSRLLSGRLRLAVLAFGLIAAVLGALTAALSGSSPLEIALWALADGLGAAGVTAFAAAEQTRERVRLTRLVQTVLATLALATLLVGCAAPKTLYSWNGYQTQVYQYLKSDGPAAEEQILAYRYRGQRFDCGSKFGYLQATVEFALRHPEVRADFEAYLNERLGLAFEHVAPAAQALTRLPWASGWPSPL